MTTRRVRRWPLTLAFFAVLAVGARGPVAAQESPAGYHRAGVIVRHGDGRLTYALVPFAEEEISGIELLERSTIPLVTVGFGALGEGVCAIEGEGCPAAECRRRVCQGFGADAPYWRVFRQAAPGDWRGLGLGPSATRVRDGDVIGWSWTGRDAGLPAASIADVARLAGAPEAATSGALPPPAVRTIYPPGVEPETDSAGQGPLAYVAAAGLLALIAGAGFVATRRGRRPVGEAT